MSRRYLLAAVNFVLFMSAVALVVAGQNKELTLVESRGGANCEAVAATLDSFVQGLKSEESIVIISYKGSRESRKGLELQRLRTARNYLTDADQARVDFYVKGAISLRITFFNGSFLALSPCVRPGS